MIYVCSPYSGDIEKNIEFAKKCCRYVCTIKNEIPIAPHIYFTQFLDDEIANERILGMDLGLELLPRCSAVWVFGGTVTKGMAVEIEKANLIGIPVKFIFEDIGTDNRLNRPYEKGTYNK